MNIPKWAARLAPSLRRLAGFRTSLVWFFFVVSVLYILYTSKLILSHGRSEKDLPICSTEISDEDNVGLILTNTSSAVDEYQVQDVNALPRRWRGDSKLELKNIVFAIAASSKVWETRKEYIKLWWRPNESRGVVWVDRRVRAYRDDHLPMIRVSENTTGFKFTNKEGQRSSLRFSRIISETLKLGGLKDVKWLVMGDDDTIFIVENVVRVLSKYDHRHFYYIGSTSESHSQNMHLTYAMAYRGAGFAVSYPLAVEFAKMQDRCIQRYPELFGSDDRTQACMAELGIQLTREPGFHQYDVYGDLLGLLGAHPVTPLVSIHHVDVVEPIFPRMTRVGALKHLFEAVKLDSATTMQQSICYDRKRYWSISVSWGYVVQILRGVVSPRELEMPTRTFLNWYKRADYTGYSFNTRPVTKHPCQKPFIFYMSSVWYDPSKRLTIGVYDRSRNPHPYCRWKMESPDTINSIVVLKRPNNRRWSHESPRRDCCRVLPSYNKGIMYIWVGHCREGEVTEL